MDLKPPPWITASLRVKRNSHLPEDLVFPVACRIEMNVPGGVFRQNWIAKVSQECTHLNGVG
jgi:hypothetical protein